MLFYFQEWSSYYKSINEQLNGYGTHYFNHEMCSKIKTIRQQIISVEMSKECSRNRWAKSLIKVLVIWNSINTFHFFGQSVTSIETDNQRSCRCEVKVLIWPSWYVLIPHKSHLRVLENMSVRYIATMLELKKKQNEIDYTVKYIVICKNNLKLFNLIWIISNRINGILFKQQNSYF